MKEEAENIYWEDGNLVIESEGQIQIIDGELVKKSEWEVTSQPIEAMREAQKKARVAPEITIGLKLSPHSSISFNLPQASKTEDE